MSILGAGTQPQIAPPSETQRTFDRIEELFAAAASQHPDAAAVVAPDGHLTYRDLDRRAREVAELLTSLGVEAEEPVALIMTSSAAMIVGALGILKAGACYVALDPATPTERLGFMLTDCAARVALVDAQLTLPSDTAVTPIPLSLDGPARVIVESTLPARRSVGSDGGAVKSPLAYVIYTSGSTGLPKGVLLEHAGLLNLVQWHQRAFEITSADKGTQIASPGFDAVVWEIWPYLAAGASIHIPPRELRADPSGLRDWLVAHEVTVSFIPTVLAEEMLALGWPQAGALRYLLTGGDRLHRPPPPGLPFTVVNNYGVTEGTVVTTSGVIEPTYEGAHFAPSIGRPIDGVAVCVAADDLTAVPPGDAGELLIAGVSVARGYLGRPELTRERFVTEVVQGEHQRWYRTGDLVRQREDGDIEFLGRVDDQVQIRGFRVELDEVAVHLDRHPDVQASVVVALGESVERGLHAYVVLRGDSRPSRQQLRDHLARTLPQYMIPMDFTWLSQLPQTENGKVDREALPAPAAPDVTPLESGATGSPSEGDEVRFALQEEIASIVSELLGLARVGANDNFFLLGGHSLLGAQLIARLGNEFGVQISLRSLFDHPTPAGLAAEVERLVIADTEALTEEEAAHMLTELSPS